MAGIASAPAAHSAHPPAKLDSAPALVSTSDNKTTAAAQVTNPASADQTPNPPNATNSANDQKKDRKPRRERLPLPDPIPTEPVKRYPEPSKADLQAAVEAEDRKLQACFELLQTTRSFYDKRQKIRDAGKPAFDAARKHLNGLNDKCREFFETRKEITTKLKTLKEEDVAARNAAAAGANELVGAGKDGAEALKNVRTIEELEDRIKDLRYTHETGTHSITEEKKLVTKISFLENRGRDFIVSKDKAFKDEKAAKEARANTRKELEEARTKQDALIDKAKAELEAQRKVVDKIRADQDAEIKKLQDDTAHVDRDEEKKKIGEIRATIRELREEFHSKLDQWYLNERIHYEQQKIAKRKKYEAAQAERDARRKAWEAEQAQYPEPDPYQEQKDMCSGLTVYLQTLLGETVEKPSVNLRGSDSGPGPSLKNASNTREISTSGKAIGKSSSGTGEGFENLAFSDFVKKSKSKKKKDRRAAAPSSKDSSADVGDTPLKPHSIDYLAAFTALEIKPPGKLSEVRAALEKVKEKRAYYDALPKPTDEEKAKMAANKTKKPSVPTSEGKSKKDTADLMNGDGGAAAFPDLLGEVGRVSAPSRDISGPSFKQVASGTAPAPPPTPAVSTVDMPSLDDEGAAGIVDSIVADEPGDDGLVGRTEPALTEA